MKPIVMATKTLASMKITMSSVMPTLSQTSNALEVDGPVPVPLPPPLGQIVGSGTVMSIPTVGSWMDDDGEECPEGQHSFQRYPASQVLVCNRCNQRIMPGTYIMTCENCDSDLCVACYSSEKASGIIGIVSASRKKVLADLESVPATNLAILNIKVTTDDSAPMKASDSVASDKTSMTASSRVKECKFCEKPYSGFGITCGDCRQSGPLVHQCRECQAFFAGFGDVCEECKPRQQNGLRGNLGVKALLA